MYNYPMIVMGLDPGTARVGWGVIMSEKGTCVPKSYGLISTDQSETLENRLCAIFDAVQTLCTTHKPDVVSVEDIYFSTNVKTAIAVSEGRGVILTAVAKMDIPLFSYSPLVVKRTVTGSGKADKKQVTDMVVRLLKLSSPPKPDDTADALAIALTHAYTVRFSERKTI